MSARRSARISSATTAASVATPKTAAALKRKPTKSGKNATSVAVSAASVEAVAARNVSRRSRLMTIPLTLRSATIKNRPPAKKRKVEPNAEPADKQEEQGDDAVFKEPSTPARKPTGTYSSADIDDATPPPTFRGPPRPVQPHMTNAPLVTPRGSRVIALPPSTSTAVDASPSKLYPGQVTTDNLLEIANAHLISVDPKLKSVIEQNHCAVFSPEGLSEDVDPFRSLTSGIMAQQVSGAAAKSIKNKFIALFPPDDHGNPKFPSPHEVAETSIERLRLAGLSQRKAEYIQGLAQKFASGELSAKMLAEADDEKVMELLIAVRGLGKWSVEMFACFSLKRTDILSTGDLGVQRGMAAYVGRDVAKLKAKGGGNKWKYMSEKEMLEISEKFSPYRSLFMWYMWRIEDVDVSAIQGD